MKRLLLATSAVALLVGQAFAADLPTFPTKAAPVAGIGTACTPTSCSGPYAGFSLGGNGSNANIIGNGINGSVFAGGVLPQVDVGYIYKTGNWLFGAELDLGYQTSSGISVNGVGANTNGLVACEMARAGGDLSALFGGQAPISIPPQLSNALISLAAQIGSCQHQFSGFWASGVASGAVAYFDIGPHTLLTVDYKNIQYSGSSNGFTPGQANVVDVGVHWKF